VALKFKPKNPLTDESSIAGQIGQTNPTVESQIAEIELIAIVPLNRRSNLRGNPTVESARKNGLNLVTGEIV